MTFKINDLKLKELRKLALLRASERYKDYHNVGDFLVVMTRLDEIWNQLFPVEQARIVKLLVEKVIVSPNDLEVRLRANGIERLVLEMRQEREEVPA